MREIRISRALLGFGGITRVVLGVGIGLLLADRLKRSRRVSVGRALLSVGGASTIPLAIGVLRRQRAPALGERAA